MGPPSARPPVDTKLKETDMSTAPIIAPELPATWAGQLPALLKKYRNFATRAEAHGDLVRMASGRDARRRSPRYQ
jgi:hypothetical protein